MTTVVQVQDIRDIIRANNPNITDSTLTDGVIGSNLRASQAFIERATNRYFADRPTQTYVYSTNGAPYIDIPGVRTVTAASWPAGVTLDLTAGTGTASLIPDAQQTGVYIGIQLRPFVRVGSGGPWWRSSPEWFDRNLDSPYYPGNYGGGDGLFAGIPNDLSISGDWGYADADLPEPFRDAVKLLAAWKTLRPGSLLSGVSTTAEGNVIDLSNMPTEVQMFISEWRLGSEPTAVSI